MSDGAASLLTSQIRDGGSFSLSSFPIHRGSRGCRSHGCRAIKIISSILAVAVLCWSAWLVPMVRSGFYWVRGDELVCQWGWVSLGGLLLVFRQWGVSDLLLFGGDFGVVAHLVAVRLSPVYHQWYSCCSRFETDHVLGYVYDDFEVLVFSTVSSFGFFVSFGILLGVSQVSVKRLSRSAELDLSLVWPISLFVSTSQICSKFGFLNKLLSRHFLVLSRLRRIRKKVSATISGVSLSGYKV